MVEEQEFAESKAVADAPQDTQQRQVQQPIQYSNQQGYPQGRGGYIGYGTYPAQPARRGRAPDDGFMQIPDGEMEELPFN